MHVKTFEALNMKDAVKAIKKEFGNDAVIISTKEKSGGSRMPQMIEVTAAAPVTIKKDGAYVGPRDNKEQNDLVVSSLNRIESKFGQLNDKLPAKSAIHSLEAGLAELKVMLFEAIKKDLSASLEGIANEAVAISNQLRLTGVEDSVITKLINHLSSLPKPENFEKLNLDERENFYRNEAMHWVMKKIRIATKAFQPGSSNVFAFVGPSSSGKTSTVCKLAARLHLKEGFRVGIIGFDNTKLAATEQLRVYAKVLGVPFYAFTDLGQLERKLSSGRECDIYLIDTPGVSCKSQDDLESLLGLSQIQVPIEFHLVLSLTEKSIQLERAIRNFSTLGLQSLVFSKLDESWTFGEMLNLTHRWSVPLSFFGNGQDLTEDFEKASRERVVERLFGL